MALEAVEAAARGLEGVEYGDDDAAGGRRRRPG
jgi:hypothetical protein